MHLYVFLIAGLIALALPSRARADIDLRVGTGAGCQHATIQAAINAANNANGVTNIKIARNVVYTAQQLNITSKNVRLIGGFADCQQGSPDGTRTVISGAGGSANTVISVLGSTSEVAFSHLDITGGDEVTSSSGLGGGVTVAGGPHTRVSFDDDYIHGNQAGYGGGVFVRNEHSIIASEVRVQFGDNTRIDNNYGAYGGGGLYCSNAQVLFVGNNSHINNNSTAGIVNGVAINGSGGGIRAENCSLWLGATSNLGTLMQNSAGGNGGGLSITGERATAYLYTRVSNRAPAILLNSAGGTGGGIEVGSSATLFGYELVVASNTAQVGGGGIALFDNDDLPHNNVTLTGRLTGAPLDVNGPTGAAVYCDPALHCNRISDNVAENNGVDMPGAAVRISSQENFVGAGSAGAYLNLYGTELSGNRGDSLLRIYHSGDQAAGGAFLTGVLVVDNLASGTLLHNPDGAAVLNLLHTTIAGNTAGSGQIMRSANFFTIRNSIVWQPGLRVLVPLDGTPEASRVDYLLLSDLTGFPVSTHNGVGDPLFRDAVHADYHLRDASPALDYAPRIVDVDGNEAATADGAQRPVDLSSIANEFGSYDLGAYELQYACAADTVFCSGFE